MNRVQGQTIPAAAPGSAGDEQAPVSARDRPRLLSYLGRWGRARRWLPAEARTVVDVGCAFGYGTAALTGTGRSRRRVIGVEPDPAHIREAARRYPSVPILQGDAGQLPLDDGAMDAVVMLDVLEHVPEPDAVLAEAHRVLRPGGVLVLSVPNRGLLAPLDSLNVYPALRRRLPWLEPLEPADESATGTHRHFTVEELERLFAGRFVVDRTTCTGLGLTEPVHLALLLTFKGLLHWGAAYRAMRPLHFVVYLLDDLVPAGRWGYHLTVRATAVPEGSTR